MIRHVLHGSLLLAALCASPLVFAATPSSGTITMTDGEQLSPTLNYASGPMPVANASPNVNGRDDYDCDQVNPCDNYTLTINLPADFRTTHPAWRIKIVTTAVPVAADIDFQVRRADNSLVGVVRDNPPAQPTFVYQPLGGIETLKLQIVPGTPIPDATASVTLYEDPAFLGSEPATIVAGGPNFRSYPYSSGGASEPTMGINVDTNAGYYINGLTVVKGTWNANGDINYSSLGTAGAVESLDPFLTVDQFRFDDGNPNTTANRFDGAANPRVWVAHLLGGTSYMAFSDDGVTWTRSSGPGQVHGADNESIVVGPYPLVKPVTALAGSYEHAMYYCSHQAVNAFCSRSDDGGLTFNPSRPIFPADASCSNHGHVKVGYDGTVMVPMNNTCQGTEGVSISIDAGENWHYIAVPGTVKGRWDPSIAMANDGKTVWFGYAEEGDDRPMIVKGILNKSNPDAPTIDWQLPATDVGVPAGLKNIAFATVVAGDPDRAAFAFHGTTKAGDSGTITGFAGAVWHLYVATTFDGGKTWNLRNATPSDPTQRNDICDQGTSCATTGNHRNLLDFMDMDIDGEGRLVLIMADGCTGGCVNGAANYAAQGTFVRQVDGKRMYAAFDPSDAAAPGTPVLAGTRSGSGVVLTWPAVNPGTGGTLVGYEIERSVDGEAFVKVAQTPLLTYTDSSATSPAVGYAYRIRALNSGSFLSEYSNVVSFTGTSGISAACTLPGIVVATDATGDQAATGSAASDIVSVSIAEPYTTASDKSLTFTMKVDDLSTVPPNVSWKMSFSVKDTAGTDRIIYLEMHTKDPLSLTPKFGYGWRDGTTDTGNSVAGIVSGSYTADGTIKIKFNIANPIPFTTLTGAAAFTAKIEPGTLIGSSTGATQLLVGAQPGGTGGGSLQPIDSSAAGDNYSVIGNAACQPNQLPSAALSLVRTYDPVPDASISADFDARGSTDADGTIVSYTFTFGDGSDPVTNSSGLVSHTFHGSGGQGFPVRVRATDDRGAVSLPSTLVQILIPEAGQQTNQAPTATLTPASSVIEAGQAVAFEVGGSDADAGDTLSYDLDFGDGSAHGTSSGVVGHTYATAGTYTATLTVSDAAGASDTATATITVEPATAPALSVTLAADRTTGDVSSSPLLVTFTAAVANDDGTPVQYTFAFGDGETSTLTTGQPTVTHEYRYAGSFHAYVTAVQDYGSRAAASDDVVITTTASVSVGATAAASLSYTLPSGNVAPADVVFDTRGSAGDSWSLSFGDTAVQTGTGLPPSSITHRYQAPGTYTATLSLADGQGNTVAQSQTVTIVAKQQLTAVLQLSTSGGVSPVDVVLDACRSIPANDGAGIVEFTMDFGDGSPVVTQVADATHVVDCNAADRRNDPSLFRHTYTAQTSTVYTPTLTVKDSASTPRTAQAKSAGVSVEPAAAAPSGGGGGSFGWLGLLPLLAAALRRRAAILVTNRA